MSETSDDESILKEIEALMRERLNEAYALGHAEGRKQALADSIAADRTGFEAIEAAARTLGAGDERDAIRAYLVTHGRSYHSASEAAKFIKRIEKFLDARERASAQ
jgi:hypothetical protein